MTVNTKAGIDPERVTNADRFPNLNEVLICKICYKILINATDCVKCGNTFCYDCINELKQVGKDCPFNCEGIHIKPTSHGINSMLSLLKFSCLNKDHGCDEILSYNNVTKHDQVCKFSIVKCPNLECGLDVKRQLLEYHIRNECEFSLFRCENCDMDFNRNEYPEHVETCKVVNECFGGQKSVGFNNTAGGSTTSNKSLNDLLQNEGVKEININTFMKVMMYQMGRVSQENERRFEIIMEEIRGLREDVSRLEDRGNHYEEIGYINDKLGYLENNFIKNGNTTGSEISSSNGSKNASVLIPSNNNTSTTSTGGIIIERSEVRKKTEKADPKQITNIKKVLGNKQESKKIFNKPQSSGGHSSRTQQTTQIHTVVKSKSPRTCGHNSHNFVTTEPSIINRSETRLIQANMDVIIDLLNQIIAKQDKAEVVSVKNMDNLQELLTEGIAEDIKGYNLQVSLDNSERIIKKLEEVLKS
jgi:hypothetical protein